MPSHDLVPDVIDIRTPRTGVVRVPLAHRSGLDPTAVDLSGRIEPDGRKRWPSTASYATVLDAIGTGVVAVTGLPAERAGSAEAMPALAVTGGMEEDVGTSGGFAEGDPAVDPLRPGTDGRAAGSPGRPGGGRAGRRALWPGHRRLATIADGGTVAADVEAWGARAALRLLGGTVLSMDRSALALAARILWVSE